MAPSRHMDRGDGQPHCAAGSNEYSSASLQKLIEDFHSLKPEGSVLGLLPPYPLVALAGDWRESTRVAFSLDGIGCQARRVDHFQERRGRWWRGECAVQWHHSWSCCRCAGCISNIDEPGSSRLRCFCTSSPRPYVPVDRSTLGPDSACRPGAGVCGSVRKTVVGARSGLLVGLGLAG